MGINTGVLAYLTAFVGRGRVTDSVTYRPVLNYSYSRLKKRATRRFFTEKGSLRSIFTKSSLWLRQFVWDCAARMNGSDGGMWRLRSTHSDELAGF